MLFYENGQCGIFGKDIEVDPTLQQLRVFVVVAGELHFHRAADTLGVSQPSVSRHIKALERTLGMELLDRTSRQVRLTPQGEYLRDQATRLISEWDSAISKVSDDSDIARHLIRVGCVEAVALEMLPRAIGIIEQEVSEGPEWELREDNSAKLVDDLRYRKYDAVAVRGPLPPDPELVVRHFFEDKLCIALPSSHDLAQRQEIQLHEIAEHPLIVYNRKSPRGLMYAIRETYRQAGFFPRIRQETSGTELLLGLVAAGKGIAYVSSVVAQAERDDVSFLPVVNPSVISPVDLVWRRDSHLPLFDHLVSILRKLVEETRLSGPGSWRVSWRRPSRRVPATMWPLSAGRPRRPPSG